MELKRWVIYHVLNAAKGLTEVRLTALHGRSIPVLPKLGMGHDVDPQEASCRNRRTYDELALFVI